MFSFALHLKQIFNAKFALYLYQCLTVDKYYNNENSKQNFNITMCQIISLLLKTNKKKLKKNENTHTILQAIAFSWQKNIW